MAILDLAATIPTRVPDVLRTLAQDAAQRSADPLNAIDDNPAIGREWLIVELELLRCAAAIEAHFADALKISARPAGAITTDPC